MEMSCCLMKLLGIYTILWLVSVESHTYHSGRCPKMAKSPDTNMTEFTGIWFAIEKSKTSANCIVYKIDTTTDHYRFEVQQEFYDPIFHTTRIHRAKLRIKRKWTNEGKYDYMKIKFNTNVVGSSYFGIFATNFTSFAGIVTCQNLGLFHRRSIAVLSRTRTLQEDTINLIHDLIVAQGMDHTQLNKIRQTGCAPSQLMNNSRS